MSEANQAFSVKPPFRLAENHAERGRGNSCLSAVALTKAWFSCRNLGESMATATIKY